MKRQSKTSVKKSGKNVLCSVPDRHAILLIRIVGHFKKWEDPALNPALNPGPTSLACRPLPNPSFLICKMRLMWQRMCVLVTELCKPCKEGPMFKFPIPTKQLKFSEPGRGFLLAGLQGFILKLTLRA